MLNDYLIKEGPDENKKNTKNHSIYDGNYYAVINDFSRCFFSFIT